MQPITKLTIEDSHVSLHSFQFYAVRHISMEANGVTHRMVKTALIQSLNQNWIDECPSFILSIVLVEQD
jgi:hypothetical protein